ncbi:MAG: hypothetical protein IPO22_02130 [Anaerolineales bacterium]|nr:hypothetical protein [Anaerolineales bacterium]
MPTVTAPPTPQGDPLESVKLQKWDISCDLCEERGRYLFAGQTRKARLAIALFANNELAVELAANSTERLEETIICCQAKRGEGWLHFNAAGSSSSKTITLGC